MSLRSFSTLLAVVVVSCASLSAQGLIREWTVPYQYRSLPMISSEGDLFARSISQTAIERYDGSTGAVRDTVVTPHVDVADRTAFCGNTLYVLSGTRNDSLHLYRCPPSETICTPTPYQYRIVRSNDVNENKSATYVGLYSIPGYPKVLVRSTIYRNYSSATYNEGRCEEVDTVTFGTSRGVNANLGRVSWSARPEAFIRFFSYSMYDIGPSPDISASNEWMQETHREKDVAGQSFPRTDGKGAYPPPGFGGSIHAGALHHVIRDTVVDDLWFKTSTPLPNRSGRILSSLYPPAYLLKVDAQTVGNIMSAYNFFNGTTIPLDTVPSCTYVWINGTAAVLYMLDTTSKTLSRYRIAPFAVADSIVMGASTTQRKILYGVEFATRMITARNAGHRYIWRFGDSTVVTDSRYVTFFADTTGDLTTSVMVVDTLINDTLSCNGPVISIFRPSKNIMVSAEESEKTVFHGCSPASDKLLISNRSTMNVYHIPVIPDDHAYDPTPLAESYAFGSYYSRDSMRFVLSEARDSTTYFRFYNTDVDMSDLLLVDTMSIGHPPKPQMQSKGYEVVFYNRALHNRELNQHMTHYRVRNLHAHDDWVHDGVWLHPSQMVPKGRWLKNYRAARSGPYQPFKQIYHADASYKSTVLLTESDCIRSVDLATMDTLFKIDRLYVGDPTEAIQVDSTTIVATNGILKYDGSWNRDITFSFDDGIKVFRMDHRHTLILRKNDGHVACVISNETGEIVEDIGDGFGTPNNGAYDPNRNLLHIADRYNYISTYTVGTPVGVDEVQAEKSYEQHLDVQSTTSGRYRVLLPKGTHSIGVYDIMGRSVMAAAVEVPSDATEVVMPPDQHSGVYLIVAHGDLGRSTRSFYHLK